MTHRREHPDHLLLSMETFHAKVFETNLDPLDEKHFHALKTFIFSLSFWKNIIVSLFHCNGDK